MKTIFSYLLADIKTVLAHVSLGFIIFGLLALHGNLHFHPLCIPVATQLACT